MYKYKITVFTPTFNRGYIIENLYKSLQRQSYKNFQWIVIDDGSEDDTEKLFEKWMSENNLFDITYKKVKNGGKHRAINIATEIAEGELFFIVDSDDYLTDYALEKVIKWEATIKNKNEFAGVAGVRGYSINSRIGNTFKGEYIDATSLERNKNNITGDKAEVFYLDILKKYKFPEFEGEKFVTEKVVWNQIAYDGYKIRWFNEIIYICDYLEDGLTKSMSRIELENPKALALSMKLDSMHYNMSNKKKIQLWFDYYILMRNKISINEMAENLQISNLLLKAIVYSWKVKCRIRGIFR